MEIHVPAKDFSSLGDPNVLYKRTIVRVHYVWKDDKQNKLYLILLDRNREKMIAVVSRLLVRRYETRNLVGEVYRLNNYKIEGTKRYHYPRYESYSFVRRDWEIVIDDNVTLTWMENKIHKRFPLYPSVPLISDLVNDLAPRKMLIDVVGVVVSGHLIKNCSTELYLQDFTSRDIKLILIDAPKALPMMIARSIKENKIIYVSRVKLIRKDNINFLQSTYLLRVVYEPRLLEADIIRDILKYEIR